MDGVSSSDSLAVCESTDCESSDCESTDWDDEGWPSDGSASFDPVALSLPLEHALIANAAAAVRANPALNDRLRFR